MRPHRTGRDVLGFMQTIRLSYPSRQRIYWIQDNLSANWTPDIRRFADANKIELVPTPTYASYLNRIESHFRPIQEFVFNNSDYPDWAPPAKPSPITSPIATAKTTTAGSPSSNANTESPHEPVTGQTFRRDPLASYRELSAPGSTRSSDTVGLGPIQKRG